MRLANRPLPSRLSGLLQARLPLLLLLLLATPAAFGAEVEPAPTWQARTLGQAIGYMLLFAAIGVVAAIAGYRLFDKCTPGDLSREIIENRNVAAAIVAAAVILGVCLIIAAAMLG